VAHDEHGSLRRPGRAKPRDEVGAAVTRIENPRFDAGNAFQKAIEMTRDDDLVAGWILRVERNEFLEQGERLALC
jgi:hypothetical protein